MSFFPPEPDMPEPEEQEWVQPPWLEAPEDELPALLPETGILAVTERVAIALVGVAVYRSGVQFRIDRLLRRDGLPLREWNEVSGVFLEHMPFADPGSPSGRLRFGVALANGMRVFADPHPFQPFGDPGAEPEGFSLSRRGGGGSGNSGSYSSTESLWLWPLPPAGPIDLVMEWPAFGIGETRITVDASDMAELATRAKRFWS